jgi:hypothetical protein
MNGFSDSQLSVINSLLSILNLDPSQTNIKVSDIMNILEDPSKLFEKMFENVNHIFDLTTQDVKSSTQILEEFIVNLELPDIIKLRESINNSVFSTLNMTWINSNVNLYELVNLFEDTELIKELRERSANLPYFEEAFGKIFDFQNIWETIFLPKRGKKNDTKSIFEQMEEDISKVTNVLTDNKSSIRETLLNTTILPIFIF